MDRETCLSTAKRKAQKQSACFSLLILGICFVIFYTYCRDYEVMFPCYSLLIATMLVALVLIWGACKVWPTAAVHVADFEFYRARNEREKLRQMTSQQKTLHV
jgi:hypothetical protein